MKSTTLGGLFMLLFGLTGCAPGTSHGNKSTVSIGEQTWAVELAVTKDQREKGLMHRSKLAPGSGMLFVFPTVSRTGFWMKNTLIPLDIIWLDKTKNVVHTSLNTPPCDQDPCPIYTTPVLSKYVLEVNGGTFTGKIGDQAHFGLPATPTFPEK